MANSKERKKYRITLSNFSYEHNPISSIKGNNSQSDFIGRKFQLDRFLNILRGVSKNRGRGAYLIAGYRGVGKTSFVNETLRRLEKGNKGNKGEFIDIRINLGNERKLSTHQVMSNMVSLLEQGLKNTRLVKTKNKIINSIIIAIYFSLIALTAATFGSFPDIILNNQNFLEKIVIPITPILLLLVMPILFLLVKAANAIKYIAIFRTLNKVENLNREIRFSSQINSGITSSWFSLKRQYSASPLSENNIERQLILILEDLQKAYNIIFVFDELDKISDSKFNHSGINSLENDILDRMGKINALLGGLKNLITTAQAKMIFISGREIYDAYLSERGNTSSLYDSLFNTYIYIPSLLTDDSDGNHTILDSMVETYVCSRLLETKYVKENSDKNIKLINFSKQLRESNCLGKNNYKRIYTLKIFIHFLTLHSWGNMKRMTTLFETFVFKNKETDNYELVFERQDLQRIVFASQLYIPFHQGLSRTLTHADDKLVVSSFAVFHYLLKFHNMSFSKSNVNRMYEALNIHSSTELSSIVDTIIDNVLRSQIRRIRNSMYRYRFSSVIEQEIHYITSISDYESAAFSFSLNATNNIKNHYLSMLEGQLKSQHAEYINFQTEQIAELYLIIGSFNHWEQSHDEANLYFGYAEKILYTEINKKSKLTENYSAILLYVEALLKRASVAERNGNYTLAAGVYHDAYTFVNRVNKEEKNNDKEFLDTNNIDSKWDILRQPYWALLYLNLKRSPSEYRRVKNIPTYPFSRTDVHHYQKGTYFSFINNYQESISEYIKTIEETDVLNVSRERHAFLGGNALIKSGMSLVTGMISTLQKILYNEEESEKSEMFYGYLESFSQTAEKFNLRLDSQAASRKKIKIEYPALSALSEVTVNLNKDNKKEYSLTNKERLKSPIKLDYSLGKYNSSVGLCDALGLVLEGAKALEKRQLYALAAPGYLTIVMLINLFQEAIPRRMMASQESVKTSLFSNPNFKKLIDESLDKAFFCQGLSTGKAFSHSMKTLWKDNIGGDIVDYHAITLESLRNDSRRGETSLPMNWHYSTFGQLTLAFFYWTDLTWCIINDNLGEAAIKNVNIDNIPPFGERFYSIMLWVKGRYHLYEAINAINAISSNKNIENIKKKVLTSATYLYRSSQYISQISSNEQNIILPPKFLVYYHQWELIHALVELYEKDSNADPKHTVRDEMTKVMRESSPSETFDTSDISTRIFDYDLLTSQVLDALKTIENMGDINSKARKELFINTYYLDDDYEDLLFTLDWTYCHSMGATALICEEAIKSESKKYI